MSCSGVYFDNFPAAVGNAGEHLAIVVLAGYEVKFAADSLPEGDAMGKLSERPG